MRIDQPFFCRIYVSEDEIYSGDLGEMPRQFRDRTIRDITEWADRLGKSGLNELIYSHLSWYEERALYCEGCSKQAEGDGSLRCDVCGYKLKECYVHDRDSKLDIIMTCIGMISRVEISAA